MTEEEYIEQIEKSNRLLYSKSEADFSVAQHLLDQLYAVKPVRAGWYAARARAIWKSGRSIEDVMNILADKSWYLFFYPGIREVYELYRDLVSSYQDISDLQRHKLFFLHVNDDMTKEEEMWIEELESQFKQIKMNFLKEPESAHAANQLLEYYYIFHNNVLYFMLNEYMIHKKIPIYTKREWFLDFPNNGFLAENLNDSLRSTFIVFDSEDSDGLDEKIIIYILQKFLKKIYHIVRPIAFQVENNIDMEETVAASMESMEALHSLNTIYPAEIICNGEIMGDNREYILAYLLQKELIGQFAVILTSGTLMDNLCCQPILKKHLERLYSTAAPALENQMVFGWAGDYLAYISQIHNTDAKELLNTPAEVSYSIIVPARNSASTLRYTLMTCLNQRYRGNYEIILSDNSTPGNAEVYQLYKELGDSRLKYYRTPREYNLSRSFEFAFLHAKGEFLLSLGSDDALLPWALEVLDNLRKRYPDEDIIQWERGFYAWPGFNRGQQNQFVIPRKYQKDNFQVDYFRREDYLGAIFNNSDLMYLLPNLYLNSGCKRDYLKKILTKTGRLFDGICQDIYMGVVNAMINDKILNIRYPLVIAGMSDSSMGARCNMTYSLNEDEAAFLSELKKTANLGGYCASPYERLMPEVTTDKSSLYNSILRMIARGVIAESDLEHLDFRKWFMDVYRQMDIRDTFFDKKIHYLRYTASLHGNEFLNWFDENLYHDALRPRLVDEERISRLRDRKTYTEEMDPFGGCVLDAARYGVNNVYDAVELFEQLSNL